MEEDPVFMAFYVLSCLDDISTYFLCHSHFMELGWKWGTQLPIGELSLCD